MNVSKSNFSASFEEILSSIAEADFISFDTEFTGLSTGEFRIHQYESIEDRYRKIKQHIEQFWVCQLGIATFKQTDTSEFVSKIFNIYMYPAHRTLNLSMSSMSFLVENGFNMNFLFKEAIPCVKASDPSWNTPSSRYGSFSLSEKNKEFVLEVENKILEFLRSNQKTLKIQLESEYQKKLLLGSHGIAPRFKNLEMKCEKKDPLLFLVNKNKKKVPEHVPKKDEEEEEREEKAEKSLVDIVKALLQRGVPLIGHYMILDVAFLYDHFIAKLPETLEEFRVALKERFPPLYDTKYISKALLSQVKFVKKTSVEDLFGYCKKRKELSEIVTIKPHESYQLSDQAHEAGYDAYMTGYIFINFLKFLSKPEEMQLALGKICVQGHYKEYIDVQNPNIDDFNFETVIKIKLETRTTVAELSLKLCQFADVFVIQEDQFIFFAEFHQITASSIEEILNYLNSEVGVKAVKFIHRHLI